MVVCAALVDHYCAARDLHRLRGLAVNSIYDGDLTVRPLRKRGYVQLASDRARRSPSHVGEVPVDAR